MIAEQLEISEVAARGAMYRLRQRYGRLIREEVAETVADQDQVDEEVRRLLEVLGR